MAIPAEAFILCGDEAGRIYLRDSNLSPLSQLLLNYPVLAIRTWIHEGLVFVYVATGNSIVLLQIINNKLKLVRTEEIGDEDDLFYGVEVFPNGRVLGVHSDKTLALWSMRLESLLAVADTRCNPTSLCLGRNGQMVVGDAEGNLSTYTDALVFSGFLMAPPSQSAVKLLQYSEAAGLILIAHEEDNFGVFEYRVEDDGYEDDGNEDGGYHALPQAREKIVGGAVVVDDENVNPQHRSGIMVATKDGLIDMFYPAQRGAEPVRFDLAHDGRRHGDELRAFDTTFDGRHMYAGFSSGQVRRHTISRPSENRHRQISAKAITCVLVFSL